jgi:hypothetical protein
VYPLYPMDKAYAVMSCTNLTNGAGTVL